MKCLTTALLLAPISVCSKSHHGSMLARSKLMTKNVALLFSLLLITHNVLAQSTSSTQVRSDPVIQSLEEIADTVNEFILSEQLPEQDVSVQVKALDRRLRLAQCTAPLDTSWSPGSRRLGRVTVEVSCASPKNWRMRVQATVTKDGMVWTLLRGVQRGDRLTRDLLVPLNITLGAGNYGFSALNSPIGDVEPWLGFVFTQRVNSGKVLSERMLKMPKLIAKGEAVVIRHRSRGLQLQTRGVALRDAAAQQQTQVRNSASGKIVDAVAVAPGIVEILH